MIQYLKTKRMSSLKTLGICLSLCSPVGAVEPASIEKNIAYGVHERQVLDFYRAESNKPTPLVLHIHGGGWTSGDKKNPPGLKTYLQAGISVASINYRYTWQAQAEGIEPPVKAPLEDAARALQFLRSKASEWNINKDRIAATGGSAGACSSLWLAFHDELADPSAKDPVSRESTRLFCAAVRVAQTSLDPKQMREWTPNSRYGGHAFGITDLSKPQDPAARDSRFQDFFEARERLHPWIEKYSPIALIDAGDPPVYLHYDSAPEIGKEQKDPTHSANFGVKLQEALRSIGVPCELVYPGAPNVIHPTIEDSLIKKLAPSE